MSEPNRPGAEAASANGQLTHRSGRDQHAPAGNAEPEDPWFAPAHLGDAPPGGDRGRGIEVSDDTGWFLRTGRAGLLPDSMTESWQESEHPQERQETAGAPPWAGDPAGTRTADAPPPWESGPWPGPGEDGRVPPAERPPVQAGTVPASPAAADTGNWQATAALGLSILPVVVPGLALGVVGLRRSRVTGTGRTMSWAAVAISAVWAVILVVWLVSSGGTAAAACGSYENAVSYQVSQVLRDLSAGAPRAVVAADFRQAISQANTAAAQAQEVAGRDAMATLTASLQQVAAESGSSETTRHEQVAAAEAAMASACKA